MKKIFFSISFVLALVATVHAQSFAVHPDSAMAGQSQLQVTIVGSGTHFKASGNLSSYDAITVSFNKNGSAITSMHPWYVFNDTAMIVLLNMPATATPGWCDMRITNADQAHPFDYPASNAFYIKPAPSKLLSVSPSSGYDSQSFEVTILGQNCGFDPDKSETIEFMQNGTTVFRAHTDSVYAANRLTAPIAIPPNAPAGYYDVRVDNPLDSFLGVQLFRVLAGPPPSISATPDTGAASTTFDVTIIGQNTNFHPTGNVSEFGLDNIDLSLGQSIMVHTNPTVVTSSTSMRFSLALPESLAAGIYDLRVSAPNEQPPFDFHIPFYVIPLNLILPNRNSGQPLSIVPVDVHAGGGHFNYYNGPVVLSVTDLQLIHGQVSIPGSSISVTSDTSLTANFSIPADAPVGSYDLRIVEPGTGRIILSKGRFTVESAGVGNIGLAASDVTSFTVSPNPSGGHIFVKFSLTRPENVRLTITDELGRTVSTLSSGMLQSGSMSFEWVNDDVANGNYFYQLVTGESTRVGRVVVRR
jgi:hypothetical protein